MKTKIIFSSNKISTETKEEMWQIYRKFYAYKKDYFMNRIEKNTDFVFYCQNNQILGFTGLKINRIKVEGKKRLLIYFGQTILSKEIRGKSLFPLTGVKLITKYFKEIIFNKAYFWADSLSYKSYLIFAKTLNECYPSRKFETPSDINDLVQFIGGTHYKDSFCAKTGTVLKPVNYVTDPSAFLSYKDLKDPDIKFFVEANSKYKEGHGLITIGPINQKNVLRLLKRYFSKTLDLSSFKKKILFPVLRQINLS